MPDPSSRMLQLLSLLQTHRYWPGTELADRLGVSPRTLRRDVDRLRELGYPVDANRGVTGGYQLQAGAALPPLILDDEEAVAIAVGLRSAASGSVAGIEETSLRALAKIVQVMPKRLRRRVDALQSTTVSAAPGPWADALPKVDSAVLTTIAMACRNEERLRFAYVARAGERSHRLVEPHRLVSLGRRWYLVAWDLGRHDWRSFRVDRLESPSVTGDRIAIRTPPGEDAAAFVKANIRALPRKYEVVVTVQAPVSQVQGTVGQWGEVEPLGEAGARLRMSVDDLGWPLMVLASLRTDFDVQQPTELVDLVAEVGARFARSS